MLRVAAPLLALLIATTLSPTFAEAEHHGLFSKRLSVEQVHVNLESSELVILGNNFTEDTGVQLAGESLEILDRSGSHLLTKLPEGINDGSYLLLLSEKARRRWLPPRRAVFVVHVHTANEIDPEKLLPQEFSVVDGRIGVGNENPTSLLDVGGTLTADALAGPWAQGESGILQLGNIQICWGRYDSNPHDQGISYTELPAPFANNRYRITTTPDYPVRFTAVITKEAGRFYAQSYAPDGYKSGAKGDYIAIGLAPEIE